MAKGITLKFLRHVDINQKTLWVSRLSKRQMGNISGIVKCTKLKLSENIERDVELNLKTQNVKPS